MLDEAGGQVLVDDSSRLLGNDRVHPIGAGGDGGALRMGGDLERGQGAGAEVGLGSGEDAESSRRTLPMSSITDGTQPVPWRLYAMPRVQWETVPKA